MSLNTVNPLRAVNQLRAVNPLRAVSKSPISKAKIVLPLLGKTHFMLLLVSKLPMASYRSLVLHKRMFPKGTFSFYLPEIRHWGRYFKWFPRVIPHVKGANNTCSHPEIPPICERFRGFSATTAPPTSGPFHHLLSTTAPPSVSSSLFVIIYNKNKRLEAESTFRRPERKQLPAGVAAGVEGSLLHVPRCQ